ncbi:MAG TPA: hypothetical protein VME63_00930, partial [Dyella sp.]|uniref:hypothetical protein n=1 Tax=Dyella sp. TaxID=1869338 RepID=UPI002BD79899
VYQLVGAWDSHDIRPDTWRSNWWYSGSVQNNYNYYAKLPPGTASYVVPNRPPIDMRPQPERPQNGLPTTSQFHDPTDGDTSNDTNPVDDPTRPQDGLSDAKSGNVKALKNLSEAFPDYFKAIGQDFTRTSVSFSGDSQLNVETAPRALAVYGGLNADNKLVEHYTFKSLGNAVNPERPFPNAIFQFIYLRPEDKDKLGTLDPGKYDTHYEDVEYIHPHPESDGTHTVWRTARFIMPKESSPAEIEKTPPDYGYLYLLDDGDPHAQQTLPGENSSIVISNFAGEKIPTTYKGP